MFASHAAVQIKKLALLPIRKAALLRKLQQELEGLHRAGALCTRDSVLESVTRQVIRVMHNIERVERATSWARLWRKLSRFAR